MFNYLKTMEDMLSAEEKDQLKAIYAPVRVAIPPSDARREMCILKDGEIRYYGCFETVEKDGTTMSAGYLSSRDCGLNWKKVYYTSNTILGPATYLPWSDKYVTVRDNRHFEATGIYAFISDIGPSDEHPRGVLIHDEEFVKKSPVLDMFLPTYFDGSHRIFVATSLWIQEKNAPHCPYVLYSDDDGESWNTVRLNPVPKHPLTAPNKMYRWQNTGVEPSIAKIPDGRLALIARNSNDYMYIYYSSDNGETWTDGEPAPFHCTLTTPYLLPLFDGRNLMLWNNTQPLPEIDPYTYWPPVQPESVYYGEWEDVFTNRDIAHAAVTSDFKTWSGCREIVRNRARNRSDYRIYKGRSSGLDRSVQQFQAFELPYGKILVAAGQNSCSREMLIFDINWLYEKGNTEDFLAGLERVSTHVYIKSVLGCQSGIPKLAGHCHWNRTHGAVIYPSPDLDEHDAVLLCTTNDPRLYSNVQGLVWNYPMNRKGKVTADMRIHGRGICFSVTDRWFNPIDVSIDDMAQISFSLTADDITPGEWTRVSVSYDLDAGSFSVYADDKIIKQGKINGNSELGLSYVHLHTFDGEADFDGTYLRELCAD